MNDTENNETKKRSKFIRILPSFLQVFAHYVFVLVVLDHIDFNSSGISMSDDELYFLGMPFVLALYVTGKFLEIKMQDEKKI